MFIFFWIFHLQVISLFATCILIRSYRCRIGVNDEVAKDKANVAQDTTNQLPQTGESKNNLAVMGLALIGSSLVALAGLLFNRKKD